MPYFPPEILNIIFHYLHQNKMKLLNCEYLRRVRYNEFNKHIEFVIDENLIQVGDQIFGKKMFYFNFHSEINNENKVIWNLYKNCPTVIKLV